MPRPGRLLSVQGWQNVVLALVAVLVLGGVAAGGALTGRGDDTSRRLIDDLAPAQVASHRLETALGDEQLAVWQYGVGGDPSAAARHAAAVAAGRAAADEVAARTADHPELGAQLNAVTAAAQAWRRQWAAPVLAAPPGTAVAPDIRAAAAFADVRTRLVAQDRGFEQARAAALAELDGIAAWRDGVLVGVVVVLVVALGLLALLVRAAVTRPLDRLAASCGRIADGDVTETIAVRGPKDIRAIARAVEDMRRRIIDELADSRATAAALAAQSAILDTAAGELRRSNAELEQFAYAASHDMQEPLRKVSAFCRLLERRYGDVLDERGRQYIDFAVDGADRMQTLIEDLLTYSRVGRRHVARTRVDVGATLAAAVADLSVLLDETGAHVTWPPQGMGAVDGDTTALRLLWQNLVANAVKFRRPDVVPQVVVTCDVDAGPDGTPSPRRRYCVADNGIGIDPAFADEVFDVFRRLHDRETFSGTGIGLAVCRKVVERHGGTIWVDTAARDGARVCFTLQTVPDGADADTSDADRSDGDAPVGSAAWRASQGAQPSEA